MTNSHCQRVDKKSCVFRLIPENWAMLKSWAVDCSSILGRVRTWTLGIDGTSLRPTDCWLTQAEGRLTGRCNCWSLPMSCSWRASEAPASRVGSDCGACCTALRRDRPLVSGWSPGRKERHIVVWQVNDKLASLSLTHGPNEWTNS